MAIRSLIGRFPMDNQSDRRTLAPNLGNGESEGGAIGSQGGVLLNTLCISYGHILGQVSVLLRFGQRSFFANESRKAVAPVLASI